MSSFFKHVGVANSKRVIIIQRQLPGDDGHMAAIIYSDILPSKYHDDVMAILESPEGQAAWEFKDILQRRMMSNGENMLQALSNEGYIKRVAQNAVIVKPNSKSSVRLDELVKLLNEVGRGEEAVKKLEKMESETGMSNGLPTPADTGEPAYRYEEPAVSPAPVAPAVNNDMTTLMQQMMQTMQSMQQEIADLKKKPARSKKQPTV